MLNCNKINRINFNIRTILILKSILGMMLILIFSSRIYCQYTPIEKEEIMDNSIHDSGLLNNNNSMYLDRNYDPIEFSVTVFGQKYGEPKRSYTATIIGGFLGLGIGYLYGSLASTAHDVPRESAKLGWAAAGGALGLSIGFIIDVKGSVNGPIPTGPE